MPIHKVTIHEFLKLGKQFPILDARSPSEYAYAHIPGAFSFPIFTDEQRKEIGTCYKQVGRQQAVKIGLNYFGPNMVGFVEQVESILSKYPYANETTVLVHCWRGGMRSGAMAWLLSFYGFDVYLLEGGYKQYRKWVLEQLNLPFKFYTLGGYTGSGKTEILEKLVQQQMPVINLEGLAKHKGSTFGNMDMIEQPAQEYFENLLANALQPFYSINENGEFSQPSPIWIESESRRIGLINLTEHFYANMLRSPIVVLDIPFEKRMNYIVSDYGNFEKEKLINAIVRIQKRLGGLDTKLAIQALLEDDIHACFRILLTYYDKQYKQYSEQSTRKTYRLECLEVNAEANLKAVLTTIIN